MVLPKDPDAVIQLLLDPTHPSIKYLIPTEETLEALEHWAEELLFHAFGKTTKTAKMFCMSTLAVLE
jgi:hypothetical protein